LQVLEAAERKPGAAPGPTIIDMRGPQARVVTNLEHLNEVQHVDDGGTVPMPELQHNLKLLVDLSEAELQKLDARIRHQKDTVVRNCSLE
jgi:tuftelin-interacting protein 11